MAWRDIPYFDEPEEIDSQENRPHDVAVSMADLERTNSFSGGTRTVLYHVAKLLRGVRPGAEIAILDVATGSGDIPAALADWSWRRGLRMRIIAVDNHPDILNIARERLGSCAHMHDGRAKTVHLVQADASRLPFPPGTFDIALCSLAFHHFGFEASVNMLRAMDRLTTRGFIVTDLRRDKLSLWGVQAALRLTARHAFTRHDGPASVRRSWTLPEYRKMAGLSGVHGVRVRSHYYFRVALVQDKARTGNA